jgi:hypothetical protein
MAGTSWAVASWVSPWLVLPYLILMALLLFPSTGRPPGEPASGGSDASDPLRSARPAEGLDDPDTLSDGPDSSGLPEEGSEQAASSKPARARRGKGRVKKARPAPEPAEATWVQVAPGKFVRVEAADESKGQAGPHSRVGDPVEVPTTPQRLEEFEEGDPSDRAEGQAEDEAPQGDESDARSEFPTGESSPFEGPIEDAGAAFEPIEGPEGDLTEDVESAASTAFVEEGETAGSSGTFEGTSAADGNAPRAEGSFESPEARTPDIPFEEAVEDRPRVETVEGYPVEDDLSSPLEDPEPDSPGAFADVPPEETDERGATLEGTDPTETPVDETDLDDAGPNEVDPLELESSRDADLSATGPLPRPSSGPSCWPWRLSPGPRTRVGHAPPRSIVRTPPPGRPVRSRRGARRPRDPRRLGRRGLARPRQVDRTFPPRSPPAGRAGRRRSSHMMRRPPTTRNLYGDFMIHEGRSRPEMS